MNIREARLQFDLVLSVQNSPDTAVKEEEDLDDELMVQPIHRSPRKRRRDQHLNNMKALEPGHQSHIMRLYDRSINLYHLKRNCTLYAASREWMENRPTKQATSPKSESAGSDAESNTVFCYDCTDTLPYPECEASRVSGSVPVRVEADISTLKKLNIKRWKRVREVWRDAYEENYRAHMECVNFIKTLHQPSADT